MATNHPQDPAQLMHSVHEELEAGVDPLGVMAPLAHAEFAWLSHPQELAEQMAHLSTDIMALQWYSWRRLLGAEAADPVKPQADDTRFADPVWQNEAQWDVTKEWYLLLTRGVQDMLYDTPGLSGKERRRAAFWWRKWLNAMAPTNFFWTNPVAQRKSIETHGESLVRGYHNFLDDLRVGNVRMASPGDFTVGKNLATTPGAVVFRNALLEVIHYAPTTEKVHEIPLVIITPWINKFYVLDLNPRKSMVKYLLDQGFNVFITSWKNPGPEMRDVKFEDYVTQGVASIVQVARDITGAPQVHAAGYCIGGTALTMYMAWANAARPEDMPVAHWTLFTTLVDFHKPGDIEVFVDEGSIRYLSRAMAARGYLDGKEMASAFRLLRSNSLIWHYVVHGYLYGEAPPPFDVLFWNMDTTRMPYAMHEWYLRELYLENKLIRAGAISVAGLPIDLGRITQPLYAVAAEDDHIAPWHQAFHVAAHIAGRTRFVLSSSGHILGIVNPPVHPPKRSYRVGEAKRRDSSEQWHARAEVHQGSWWPEWAAWLASRCGAEVPAMPVTTEAYPRLADAPGAYVREK
ncbi:MAG: alpha/beta fold hydrolase [Rhodocyclaceae bacterium]|nr:alpha/beta fold hydrolase [Rhodocyclaceae bacterium]